MPAKVRGRTSRYRSAAPAGGSLIPGRIGTASCVTLGGADRGLAYGSSADRDFLLMAGETYAWRLAPGTTCVVCPKINPARALLDPLPRDMRRRLPTIWYLGDAAALWRNGTRSLLDSNLCQSDGYPDVVFPGDASMGYQFGQASLASPPTPDFGTGAALARPLLQVPAIYAWGDTKLFFDRRPGFLTCLM